MDSHLLPAADSSPPCATFSQSLGIRPAGTGLALDRIVLVSVPEPWPKPALNHPWLKPSVPHVTGSVVPTRLFAAAPTASELAVELYERDGLGFRSFRWIFDDPAEVEPIVRGIAETPLGAIHGMVPIDVTVPTFLVCTQGSHDRCCGTFGTDLAAAIEHERLAYRVRRVSHTGGHRFAPTFIALPSGRMWAYADLALVDRVAAGSVTATDLSMYCRGWLGARSGAAQVAELAARAAAGNPFVVAPMINVEPVVDGITRCQVAVGGETTVVSVRPGRAVPTIACEAPGGLPAKTATEFDWTVLEDPWN